jgi:hypothetical protein
MILAHIAGIPIEEGLLAMGPVGVLAAGLWLRAVRQRLAQLRSR